MGRGMGIFIQPHLCLIPRPLFPPAHKTLPPGYREDIWNRKTTLDTSPHPHPRSIPSTGWVTVKGATICPLAQAMNLTITLSPHSPHPHSVQIPPAKFPESAQCSPDSVGAPPAQSPCSHTYLPTSTHPTSILHTGARWSFKKWVTFWHSSF